MIKRMLFRAIGIQGPWNGWKTVSGLGLMLLAHLFPLASPAEHAEMIAAVGNVVHQAGVLVAAWGAIHKVWKRLTAK